MTCARRHRDQPAPMTDSMSDYIKIQAVTMLSNWGLSYRRLGNVLSNTKSRTVLGIKG